MVLKFRLISNERDEFIRDFEILDEQTFFQFHMAIQEHLHFDKSQIASFFVCNDKWEKQQEIALFELSDEENAGVLVMDHTLIRDHISKVHDKLLYVFDVFNERLFFIELAGTSRPDPSVRYPHCSFKKGQAPQQILMDTMYKGPGGPGEDTDAGEGFFSEEMPGPDELDELGYNTFDDSNPDEQ